MTTFGVSVIVIVASLSVITSASYDHDDVNPRTRLSLVTPISHNHSSHEDNRRTDTNSVTSFTSMVMHHDIPEPMSGGLTVLEPPKGWPFSDMTLKQKNGNNQIKVNKYNDRPKVDVEKLVQEYRQRPVSQNQLQAVTFVQNHLEKNRKLKNSEKLRSNDISAESSESQKTHVFGPRQPRVQSNLAEEGVDTKTEKSVSSQSFQVFHGGQFSASGQQDSFENSEENIKPVHEENSSNEQLPKRKRKKPKTKTIQQPSAVNVGYTIGFINPPDTLKLTNNQFKQSNNNLVTGHQHSIPGNGDIILGKPNGNWINNQEQTNNIQAQSSQKQQLYRVIQETQHHTQQPISGNVPAHNIYVPVMHTGHESSNVVVQSHFPITSGTGYSHHNVQPHEQVVHHRPTAPETLNQHYVVTHTGPENQQIQSHQAVQSDNGPHQEEYHSQFAVQHMSTVQHPTPQHHGPMVQHQSTQHLQEQHPEPQHHGPLVQHQAPQHLQEQHSEPQHHGPMVQHQGPLVQHQAPQNLQEQHSGLQHHGPMVQHQGPLVQHQAPQHLQEQHSGPQHLQEHLAESQHHGPLVQHQGPLVQHQGTQHIQEHHPGPQQHGPLVQHQGPQQLHEQHPEHHSDLVQHQVPQHLQEQHQVHQLVHHPGHQHIQEQHSGRQQSPHHSALVQHLRSHQPSRPHGPLIQQAPPLKHGHLLQHSPMVEVQQASLIEQFHEQHVVPVQHQNNHEQVEHVTSHQNQNVLSYVPKYQSNEHIQNEQHHRQQQQQLQLQHQQHQHQQHQQHQFSLQDGPSSNTIHHAPETYKWYNVGGVEVASTIPVNEEQHESAPTKLQSNGGLPLGPMVPQPPTPPRNQGHQLQQLLQQQQQGLFYAPSGQISGAKQTIMLPHALPLVGNQQLVLSNNFDHNNALIHSVGFDYSNAISGQQNAMKGGQIHIDLNGEIQFGHDLENAQNNPGQNAPSFHISQVGGGEHLLNQAGASNQLNIETQGNGPRFAQNGGNNQNQYAYQLGKEHGFGQNGENIQIHFGHQQKGHVFDQQVNQQVQDPHLNAGNYGIKESINLIQQNNFGSKGIPPLKIHIQDMGSSSGHVYAINNNINSGKQVKHESSNNLHPGFSSIPMISVEGQFGGQFDGQNPISGSGGPNILTLSSFQDIPSPTLKPTFSPIRENVPMPILGNVDHFGLHKGLFKPNLNNQNGGGQNIPPTNQYVGAPSINQVHHAQLNFGGNVGPEHKQPIFGNQKHPVFEGGPPGDFERQLPSHLMPPPPTPMNLAVPNPNGKSPNYGVLYHETIGPTRVPKQQAINNNIQIQNQLNKGPIVLTKNTLNHHHAVKNSIADILKHPHHAGLGHVHYELAPSNLKTETVRLRHPTPMNTLITREKEMIKFREGKPGHNFVPREQFNKAMKAEKKWHHQDMLRQQKELATYNSKLSVTMFKPVGKINSQHFMTSNIRMAEFPITSSYTLDLKPPPINEK